MKPDTFIDARVEVAVLLGVRSDPPVLLVDDDAHLREQLHLLLVQVVRGDLRHAGCRRGASQSTVEDRQSPTASLNTL